MFFIALLCQNLCPQNSFIRFQDPHSQWESKNPWTLQWNDGKVNLMQEKIFWTSNKQNNLNHGWCKHVLIKQFFKWMKQIFNTTRIVLSLGLYIKCLFLNNMIDINFAEKNYGFSEKNIWNTVLHFTGWVPHLPHPSLVVVLLAASRVLYEPLLQRK